MSSHMVDRRQLESGRSKQRRGRSPNASAAYTAVLRRMLTGALLVAVPHASLAQALPPAEACLRANQNLSLGAPLSRTWSRLKSGSPVKIVAVGSSSTVGLWMLSPAATYPEVMRRELVRLVPHADIQIVNSGTIGDTIPGNIARFDRDVLSVKPDLVIWQLGTNDVAWGGHADGLKDLVAQGVRALRASGADVILMDLQYAPFVLASSHVSIMQAIIADVARQEHVGLFSRFAVMQRSVEAGLSPTALVSWDGLHHSADGYDCVGRALARAVATSSR
jgi:acyl-CoA thioesterase I